MRKLEEIQQKKLVSAYGGVGSIVDTFDNGSLIIKPYDNWECYRRNGQRQVVEDKRLLKEVNRVLRDNFRNEVNDNQIQQFYRLPDADEQINVYSASNGDLNKTIKSDYFPSWYYCTRPRCRRLYKLANWQQNWNTLFPRDNKFRENHPSCCYCSNQQPNGIHRVPLEQLRFLMVSLDTGKVEDIPLERLPFRTVSDDGRLWDLDNLQNPRYDLILEYHTSRQNDGLESISIYYRQPDDRNVQYTISLAQLNNKYIKYNNGIYRLGQKSQNNLYFPSVVSSIFIPMEEDLVVQQILQFFQGGTTGEQLHQTIRILHPTVSRAFVENVCNGTYEVDFNKQEFLFLVNPNTYENNFFSSEDLVSVHYPNLNLPFVTKAYALLRLKETSTVPYYTRVVEAEASTNWYSLNAGEEILMQPRKIKTFERRNDPNIHNVTNNINYMPVVEHYGEGLLLELNFNTDQWLQEYCANHNNADYYILAHTFSHMIMKELEFTCGYPLSSLKEKIYRLDDDSRIGIMIYTIAGSEGSYGGIISLFPTNATDDNGGKILQIIQRAIVRSQDCPNDPICLNESAHCYACLDIPEISCCDWNNNLNRNLFIMTPEALRNCFNRE